jgi:hypothetical protein
MFRSQSQVRKKVCLPHYQRPRFRDKSEYDYPNLPYQIFPTLLASRDGALSKIYDPIKEWVWGEDCYAFDSENNCRLKDTKTGDFIIKKRFLIHEKGINTPMNFFNAFLTEPQRHFYEIVLDKKSVKLYFDLEITPQDNQDYFQFGEKNFESCLRNIKSYFEELGVKINFEEIQVQDASRQGKHSRHLVLPYYVRDYFDTESQTWIKAVKVAEIFARKINSLMKENNPLFKVDLGVYHSNQEFRFPGNSKLCKKGGQLPALKILSEWKLGGELIKYTSHPEEIVSNFPLVLTPKQFDEIRDDRSPTQKKLKECGFLKSDETLIEKYMELWNDSLITINYHLGQDRDLTLWIIKHAYQRDQRQTFDNGVPCSDWIESLEEILRQNEETKAGNFTIDYNRSTEGIVCLIRGSPSYCSVCTEQDRKRNPNAPKRIHEAEHPYVVRNKFGYGHFYCRRAEKEGSYTPSLNLGYIPLGFIQESEETLSQAETTSIHQTLEVQDEEVKKPRGEAPQLLLRMQNLASSVRLDTFNAVNNQVPFIDYTKENVSLFSQNHRLRFLYDQALELAFKNEISRLFYSPGDMLDKTSESPITIFMQKYQDKKCPLCTEVLRKKSPFAPDVVHPRGCAVLKITEKLNVLFFCGKSDVHDNRYGHEKKDYINLGKINPYPKPETMTEEIYNELMKLKETEEQDLIPELKHLFDYYCNTKWSSGVEVTTEENDLTDFDGTPKKPQHLGGKAFRLHEMMKGWSAGMFEKYTLLVKAGMGTGKTHEIRRFMKEYSKYKPDFSALIVSVRRSLTKDNQRRFPDFPFESYLDLKNNKEVVKEKKIIETGDFTYQEILEEVGTEDGKKKFNVKYERVPIKMEYEEITFSSKINARFVICQVESLHLIEKEKYDLIILDELSGILSQFVSSPNHRGKQAFNQANFERLLRNAEIVLGACGDLSKSGVEMIQKMMPGQKVYLHHKKYQVRKGYQAKRLSRPDQIALFEKKVLLNKEKTAKGERTEKIVIFSNSKAELDNLVVPILIAHQMKFLYHNSDTPHPEILDNLEESWINYDYVLMSPTITQGCDFSLEYFDCAFLFVSNMSCPASEVHQQLARVRHLRDKVVYFSVEISKVSLPLSLKKICRDERTLFSEMNKTMTSFVKPDDLRWKSDGQNGYFELNLEDRWTWLTANQILALNKSRVDILDCLWFGFKDQGYECLNLAPYEYTFYPEKAVLPYYLEDKYKELVRSYLPFYRKMKELFPDYRHPASILSNLNLIFKTLDRHKGLEEKELGFRNLPHQEPYEGQKKKGRSTKAQKKEGQALITQMEADPQILSKELNELKAEIVEKDKCLRLELLRPEPLNEKETLPGTRLELLTPPDKIDEIDLHSKIPEEMITLENELKSLLSQTPSRESMIKACSHGVTLASKLNGGDKWDNLKRLRKIGRTLHLQKEIQRLSELPNLSQSQVKELEKKKANGEINQFVTDALNREFVLSKIAPQYRHEFDCPRVSFLEKELGFPELQIIFRQLYPFIQNVRKERAWSLNEHCQRVMDQIEEETSLQTKDEVKVQTRRFAIDFLKNYVVRLLTQIAGVKNSQDGTTFTSEQLMRKLATFRYIHENFYHLFLVDGRGTKGDAPKTGAQCKTMMEVILKNHCGIREIITTDDTRTQIKEGEKTVRKRVYTYRIVPNDEIEWFIRRMTPIQVRERTVELKEEDDDN